MLGCELTQLIDALFRLVKAEVRGIWFTPQRHISASVPKGLLVVLSLLLLLLLSAASLVIVVWVDIEDTGARPDISNGESG